MPKPTLLLLRAATFASALSLLVPAVVPAADYQILGWNNLGMHCMDSDYSVFSILPPFNTIECQIVATNRLVTNGAGYTITYQAVADPTGSSNSTSIGKGNFYVYDELLYGTNLPAEMGLAGWAMPGIGNTPQAMTFERTNSGTRVDWWRAEGIPITPYDNAGKKNPYPMMRLIARRGATAIATNDIVLPVSDEMDCRACHASGTQTAAKPAAGWVWSSEPERDFRLNILRLHDERNFTGHHDLYVSALAARGFNPQGLYRGVVADGHPVLCAVCHASEALGSGSYSNIPPLTTSVHSKHATVLDPELDLTLDHSDHRAACYRCHPGSATKCLRGAMGGAIASDGSMAMQCQSCHGNMSHVGRAGRHGWLEEPNCQQCHTGTATSNNGQIRYTSCFTDSTNWIERVAVNQTFATKSNTPAPDISLYRFSTGHGGLQCSACHGSTHAEFPATHRNDNVRNEKIQGHAGVMVECTKCHVAMSISSATATNGPHGMHPIGQAWVDGHHDVINENQTSQCRVCHGMDYRGTPLSRMQSSNPITVNRDDTIISFPTYRGAEVGCYNCHNGPSEGDANTTANPLVNNLTTNTLSSQPLSFALPITGSGASGRVINQPSHGSVGVVSNVATYFPEAGFVGTDTFAFAAWNGSKNSLLATGTVIVAQGPFSISAKAHVPGNAAANWPAPFNVVPAVVNHSAPPSFDWDFGDGLAHATNQFATHVYTTPGSYAWRVISRVGSGANSASATNAGTILVTGEMLVSGQSTGGGLTLSWPANAGDAVLEQSTSLDSAANWQPVPDAPSSGGGSYSVNLDASISAKFFRVRQVK